MLLGLLALHVLVYHGVALHYNIYPPLPSFFFYLLPIVTLNFTHLFFVLVLYTLPLSLVPALCPTIQSYPSCAWYIYHAIALGYNVPSPIVLSQIIY